MSTGGGTGRSARFDHRGRFRGMDEKTAPKTRSVMQTRPGSGDVGIALVLSLGC